jgi:hypothetical protein
VDEPITLAYREAPSPRVTEFDDACGTDWNRPLGLIERKIVTHRAVPLDNACQW